MKKFPFDANLEVEGLRVVYNPGTFNETVALDGVSFKVTAGEKILITGDNGSGKSTLFGAISGSISSVSGKVVFGGEDITNWKLHRRAKVMAFVHQDPLLGTCPNMTVHENFQLSLGLSRFALAPYSFGHANCFYKLLEDVNPNLVNYYSKPLRMLSGGQRQIVATCLAVCKNKPLICLDEFTSAIDASTKALLLKTVIDLIRRSGKTLIVISHETNFSDFNDFRKIYISNGKITY